LKDALPLLAGAGLALLVVLFLAWQAWGSVLPWEYQ